MSERQGVYATVEATHGPTDAPGVPSGTSGRTARADAAWTEKQLQQVALDLARMLGYGYRYHTWNSQHSAAGFPDCVLTNGKRVLFVECKTERGRLSAAQTEWLAALSSAGAETLVLRPSGLQAFAELLRAEVVLTAAPAAPRPGMGE